MKLGVGCTVGHHLKPTHNLVEPDLFTGIFWWRIPDSNRGPADYDAQTSFLAMFGCY